MKRFFLPGLLLLWVATAGCHATERVTSGTRTPIDVIAFGSCAGQDQPQPIWHSILAQRPDLFLFIGDNIYGDTENMDTLRAKYARLGAQPGFRAVRETVPMLATWDDHDYGVNDGGAEYPQKKASQQVFLDFFGVPADSPRRQREGVYDAHIYGPPGRRVQVILLDTRYHRGPLRRWPEGGRQTPGPYAPNEDPGVTMLGEAQWAWLAGELRKPAEVRIIASSIQVVPEEHGWEGWGTMPRERERLFRLVHETNAKGVLFISGDRHLAELSRLAEPNPAGYPLYDLTSSSLNRPSRSTTLEPNRHRVHDRNYLPINFGIISIDWNRQDPLIRLEIRNGEGAVALDHEVQLSELR